MKFTFSLLFLSIFGLNLSAQTEFMPLGSNLYTNFVSLGFSGSAVFNAEKDTICDGLPCRKINIFKKDKRTNIIYKDSVFFQQRGDSIFEYSQYFKKSNFLFKNKYAVGDSLLIERSIGVTNVVVATIYIDSIINFNGIKRYASRIKCRPINASYPTVLNEFNLYDRFFPFYHWDIHLYCQASYYDGLSFIPLCYN
jgi:hypothetical protein